MDTKQRIADFVKSQLISGVADTVVGEEASLIEAGVIDSLGIQKLIAFIEREFEIRLKDEEIVPENFDSINAIVEFVHGKQGR